MVHTPQGRAEALCYASGYHRGTHTDRTGHALRLYTMTAGQIHTGTRCGSTMYARTHTHRGRTQPHSEPQRWLPAQCTTPTIGQPQRARVYIQRTGTPAQGAQIHTDSLSGRAYIYSEQEHPQRARAYTMHTIGAKFPPRPPIVYCIY